MVLAQRGCQVRRDISHAPETPQLPLRKLDRGPAVSAVDALPPTSGAVGVNDQAISMAEGAIHAKSSFPNLFDLLHLVRGTAHVFTDMFLQVTMLPGLQVVRRSRRRALMELPHIVRMARRRARLHAANRLLLQRLRTAATVRSRCVALGLMEEDHAATAVRSVAELAKACICAREKKKAPGPCELRACCVTRRRGHARGTAKAHHRAPPDLAIRQRRLCSGARPSAQPKSLARRDRNRFRSLQGG